MDFIEEFKGILSLLIACIELVFLINIFIFAEKNSITTTIKLMVGLLFSYQFTEFIICYIPISDPVIVYIAYSLISLLPPLGLYLALNLNKIISKWNLFVFIPALFFIFYYPVVLNEFKVLNCTVLLADYEYPLPDIFGVVYYLAVLATIFLLVRLYKKEYDNKTKNNTGILLLGYLLAFLPPVIIFLIFPSLINYVESFLCKFAFILALTLTIFAIRNKPNNKVEETSG